VELAHQLVTSDPEILRGEPVFSGTRVPIDNVLASADGDISPARLRASYPFLTPAHIEAARTYAAVHPRRGRPRRLSEIDPRWQLARSTVIERRS
jgi:uncharacterized protein (DUF433 family)